MKLDHWINTTAHTLCTCGVPIFNHLTHEEMLEIVQVSVSKSYKKGETIFQAEDSSDRLYIIHKGKVKIYRLSDTGKEQILRILEPGDFFGELSLFAEETLSSFAEALENTEVCTIHKKDMHQILIRFPAIALKILEEFSLRLNTAEKLIEKLSSHDVEKRLAAYLIEMMKTHAHSKEQVIQITLPMSKKDLASYLGASQETISRRLSAFEDEGLIKQTGQRQITIYDYQGLRAKA